MILYVFVLDMHACVYFFIVCEHDFLNTGLILYIICYRRHIFLSIHSVLMFRLASSMKENSKLTAVQNNSRKDLDADSIYPRTHF